MARFSLVRVLSRPSCRWESEAITESRGSWEGTGWAQAVRKTLTLLRISWATINLYRETLEQAEPLKIDVRVALDAQAINQSRKLRFDLTAAVMTFDWGSNAR